jgi:hypothetical protein
MLTVGTDVSMRMFLFELSEPVAPGVGNVRLAATDEEFLIVPPLSESAL